MAESLEDSKLAAAGTSGDGPSLFGGDFTARLAMNPQTRPFLSQPDFLAMLRDMSTNPQSMTKYMNDPRFQVQLPPSLHCNSLPWTAKSSQAACLAFDK